MDKDYLQFKFSGKMARLLGRESVSSETAALFELVKNGYDADANLASIIFENFKPNQKKERRIIVKDDGDGMTFEDIENKWMIIGTESKERKEFSNKGRRVVGNKGVGRFATEKLAKKVTIISKPRDSTEEIIVNVNWPDYEKKDVLFTDVKNHYKIIPNRSNKEESGVTIVLEGLRDEWDKKKITKLKKSVSSIILPKELQKITKKPFNAVILAPDLGLKEVAEIDSILFDKAPFIITASLGDKQHTGTMTIKKKGKIVKQPKIELGDVELRTGGKWKPFGQCTVKIYFYPGRNKYENWDDYYHDVMSINRIQTAIKDYHGMKIYRDGFWVRPYGGPDDDWLDLESARVQSNLRVGNSQVIGFIQITKDGNPGIIDTTTRERLVENTAFESMRRFLQEVFDELLEYRTDENKVLRQTYVKIEHENAMKNETKKIEGILNKNKELDEDDIFEIKYSLKKIARFFTDFKQEMDEEQENLLAAERNYRNLAALGISSAASYHEIFNVISGLSEIPIAISNLLKTRKVKDDQLTEILDDLQKKISTINNFTWFIKQYVKNIGQELRAKLKKEPITLKQETENTLKHFEEMADEIIDIEVKSQPSDLTVVINRVDFLSILMNLFTNSVKSLSYLPEHKKKKVKISYIKDTHALKIKFSDNGRGIKDEIMKKIFRPLFTTYENSTGLGLTIVTEILDSYGGKIEVLPESELDKGATFLITIPWEKLSYVK